MRSQDSSVSERVKSADVDNSWRGIWRRNSRAVARRRAFPLGWRGGSHTAVSFVWTDAFVIGFNEYRNSLRQTERSEKAGKAGGSVQAVHSAARFPAFTKAVISAIIAVMLGELLKLISELLRALLVETLLSRVRKFLESGDQGNIKRARLVIHARCRQRLLNSLSTAHDKKRTE